jgi:hypothetical protein
MPLLGWTLFFGMEANMNAVFSFLISVGIIAFGIRIIAGSIAAGSPLAWALMGLLTAIVGSISLYQQLAISKSHSWGESARIASRKTTGWKRPFDKPIPLPPSRQLVTLEDAGRYITKLPKAEHEADEWQAAIEALILVARGGPMMLARIGLMRALNRHVERVFNPNRKDHHWGRRKLARDRWRALPSGGKEIPIQAWGMNRGQLSCVGSATAFLFRTWNSVLIMQRRRIADRLRYRGLSCFNFFPINFEPGEPLGILPAALLWAVAWWIGSWNSTHWLRAR